jgi:[ribosomal protein S5]-alanine N-acetyltransferase
MLKINFDPFPNLKTERLELRRLKMEDENEIFAIRSDKRMSEYLDRPLYEKIDEARKFINYINNGIAGSEWIYWAVTLKGDPKLIGTICLWQINMKFEKAEIGFELLPDYQGRGLMLEAATKVVEYGFEKMNLGSIEGEVDPKNIKSIKLMEKLNFERIYEIREGDPDAVKELKTVMYGLLKTNASYSIIYSKLN